MSVIKNGKKQTRFTTIDNAPINNINLSYPAVGLLIYVVSKPENWEIRISDLMKRQKPGAKPGTPCGKQMIQSILKELQSAGHAKLQARRGPDGKVSGREWVFYEEAQTTDNAVNRQSAEPTIGLTDDRATPPINKKDVLVNTELLVNTYTHTQGAIDLSETTKIKVAAVHTETPFPLKSQNPITPPVPAAPPVSNTGIDALSAQILSVIQEKTGGSETVLDTWRQRNPALTADLLRKEIKEYARYYFKKIADTRVNEAGMSEETILSFRLDEVKRKLPSHFRADFAQIWLPRIGQRTGTPRPNSPKFETPRREMREL